MGWKPDHGRMKPKYNPVPTPREKAYHKWLMENHTCICCGRPSEVVHHPLERHPKQRWRRDHEYVVPMRAECHMELHAAGSEGAYDPTADYPQEAARYRLLGKWAGKL